MAISPRTADNRWRLVETSVAVLAAVTAAYLTDRGTPFLLVLALGFFVGSLGVATVLGIQALVGPGVQAQVEAPSRQRRTSGMVASDGSGIARRDEEILREIAHDR